MTKRFSHSTVSGARKASFSAVKLLGNYTMECMVIIRRAQPRSWI